MPSVTQRIKAIKQPRGGYIKSNDFIMTDLPDNEPLNEIENVSPILIGLAVDYLTSFLNGTTLESAFSISLRGAQKINKLNYANELLLDIKGMDDVSIIHACKMAVFDVVFRAGVAVYRPVEHINPDQNTIDNIRIMVKRSLSFFEDYVPIVKDGFTFEGGYTALVTTGDGDFLTEKTL